MLGRQPLLPIRLESQAWGETGEGKGKGRGGEWEEKGRRRGGAGEEKGRGRGGEEEGRVGEGERKGRGRGGEGCGRGGQGTGNIHTYIRTYTLLFTASNQRLYSQHWLTGCKK